jgi:hypothetical protein
MKKSIIFLVTMAFLAVGFTSCKEESAGKTGVVDYVVLKLIGDKQIKLSLGDAYEEPGWTATDKGKDVHDKVKVTIVDMMGDVVDAVTTDIPGIFTITYSAISEDNRPISLQRQVLVFDPTLTASIEGAFAVDFAKSERVDGSRNWTWQEWSDYYTSDAWAYADYSLTAIDINFKELVPGIYEADDLLGGFYTGLRGYGPVMEENNGPEYYHYYSMGGMVVLSADMSISLVSSYVPAWGDGLAGLTGTFDEATGTLEIHSDYGDMDFHVIMVKK